MLGAVHLGGVEEDVLVFGQGLAEGFSRHAQCFDVDPREVGAFRLMQDELRKVGMQEIAQVAEIAVDRFVQFIQPLFRLIVCRHLGHQAEGIESVDLVDLQRVVDLGMEFFIGHEDIRAEQSGDVKRLAGGSAYTEIRIVDDDGRKGRIGLSGEGELAMDLVAEYEQVLAAHDVRQAL